VYLIPTFHNPTGNTLSDLQRRLLVELAQQINIPLIEDLTLAHNALEREPPPPLASYAQEGAVITIGSLSKIFWAGLRVGWIRGAVPLIERLARLKGGLFVWAHLPEGDVRELAQEALQEGVLVLPGTTLSVDGTHTAFLRLPLFLTPDRLQSGMERLSAAWDRYTQRMRQSC
jgi:DNA-binding transcriptional MocR family regulator